MMMKCEVCHLDAKYGMPRELPMRCSRHKIEGSLFYVQNENPEDTLVRHIDSDFRYIELLHTKLRENLKMYPPADFSFKSPVSWEGEIVLDNHIYPKHNFLEFVIDQSVYDMNRINMGYVISELKNMKRYKFIGYDKTKKEIKIEINTI